MAVAGWAVDGRYAVVDDAYFARRRADIEAVLARDKTPVAPFWVNKYKKEV